MRIINKIIMTFAGLLLIVAAGLTFHEMIDTCVPSWDAKAQAVITTAQQAGQDIPQWKATVLGIWESYEFFLVQIPLEFALGVWMVSGLFRKAAWFAGTLAYFLFIFVTLTKWLTGAESCGCFGQVHVDPKITLFAIDIPFFLLLTLFRPKGTKLLPPPWPNVAHLLLIFIPTIALMVAAPAAMVALQPDCIKIEDQPDASAALELKIFKLKKDLSQKQQTIDQLQNTLEELRKTPRTTDTKATIGVLEVVAADKPNVYEITIGGKQTLLLNAENLENIVLSIQDSEKQTITVTESGQVKIKWTEPQITETNNITTDANETAPVAEQWDWMQYVVEDDVREQLTQGLVVVMMHRYDCIVCEEMAPRYSEYYQQLVDQNANEFKVAFLAIPPYGDEDHVPDDTQCIQGKLTDEENWQLMSPVVVALLDGQLVKQWEQGTSPEPENLLSEIFGE